MTRRRCYVLLFAVLAVLGMALSEAIVFYAIFLVH